jgi:type I restriction-modification system DNA methylase subunit
VVEPITEWEYVAEIKSWVDQIIASDPTLPFSEARVEQRGEPSLKRRDLTLLDRNKEKVLTGEVKLPFQKDGATPYNHDVVEDARAKAYRAKVGYFFTWNINEFVLWETFPKALPYIQTNREHWKVVSVASADQLRHPSTEQAVKGFLRGFLKRFAQIYLGVERIAVLPLDDKFINEIESFLEAPIQLTIVELNQRYRERVFRFQLDAWMREQQGWLLSDDPAVLQDLLDRSAKAACYALVIRLLFYEALLKRYGDSLRKLDVPEHIGTGQSLEMHLAGFFDDARNVTSDYETVFREEKQDIGLRIPFLADSCVDHWRNLIDEINRFDLSKLDYDVIGRMFERLIDPHERHKYGQYYTRPQVVDLINSFCISSADAKVMDPACGGGTFLVRAYARKKCLSQSRQHRQLLSELYGIDVSPYATHLTTINLAVRELVEEENYPQVATNDFFNISTGKRFLQLPDRKQTAAARSAGLGRAQQRDISIPPLDAVVGNPPYVRQEGIASAKVERSKAKQKGTKEYYGELVEREAGFRPSGRSDLHIYFWPHAAAFLKDDGWFGFLTSSQWLDVEYGFKLQEWILRNFAIIAVIESRDEPWFVGARVATAITILRREQDAKNRMENVVRFVQLRAPIDELLPFNVSLSVVFG